MRTSPGTESLPSGARSSGDYLVSDYTGLISVVVPAFNEADRVRRCLYETHDTLETLGCRFEILLVDDGSTDATRSRAHIAARQLRNVRVLSAEENVGKGNAVMHGAYAAKGDLILSMDADLEVHPRQLSILYHALAGAQADISIGSKIHPLSTIEYPLKRRMLSRGYYWLVRLLFRLPVRDTQTGLKLFRREVLWRVGPRLAVKRFAHDLELLVNAHRLGYKVVESPIVVTREREFPRVGSSDALLVARDTAAIWYRTHVLRYYDRLGEKVDAVLAEGGGLKEVRHALLEAGLIEDQPGGIGFAGDEREAESG